MKTFLKVVIGLVGVAALLFVALIVAVTLLFEPNDYRPYIVNAVEDATGRPFELQGDLGLSVLPCCSVSLGPSRLGSPPGFDDQDFASLQSASLSIRLWPLLTRREVDVGAVTLDGLELSLVRLADGRDNWTFEGSQEPASDQPGTESSAAPLNLSVEQVVLNDGRVHFRDRQAALDYTVHGLSLDSEIALSDDRLTVSEPRLALTLTGADLPDEIAVVLVMDQVTADLATAEDVTVAGLSADVSTLGTRLRVTGAGQAGAAMDLRGDFALDEVSPRAVLAALSAEPYAPADPRALNAVTAKGRWALVGSALSLEELAVRLDDSTLSGNAAVSDLESGAATFDLTLDQIDVDAYLPADDAGAAPPPATATGGEPTVLPLEALAASPLQGTLRIGRLRSSGVEVSDVAIELSSRDGDVTTSLSAATLGGTVELNGSGNVAGAQPALAGRLRMSGMTPRTALASLGSPVETADPNVLRRLTAAADWRLTPRTAGLANVRVELDDSTLTGSLDVADFDSLAARFDLALDRMNVDAYLPPESPDTEPPASGTEAAESLIPVELIRELALDGRLRAGELTLMKITLRDLLAQVRAADGVLRIDPVQAGLYGGAYRGAVAVDATGQTARITLDQELSAVQVSEVLSRFFSSDLLGGSLSLKLTGAGTGNTSSELLRGLAADVQFDLSDGVYRGMNVLHQLQKARATLKNEPQPAPPESNETPIRALHASGRMADGVLQTRELTAQTDALGLTGKGGINLLELALDYDLNARVLGDAAKSAKLGDLANLSIPLSIEGPLRSPRVGVDMQGMLTSTLRDTAETKAREALLKRLGGGSDASGGGTSPEPGAGAGSAAAPTASATNDSGDTPAAADSAAQKPAKPSTRDLLKQGLRDLIKAPEQKPPEGKEAAEPPGA